MARTIDARGLPCPQPVLKTRKGLEETGWRTLEILVDADAARENVARMLESRGFPVEITEENGEYRIVVANPEPVRDSESDRRNDMTSEARGAPEQPSKNVPTEPIVVFIGSDRIGQGDDELGRILVNSFLYTLPETDIPPDALVLMNSGVKLAVHGSETLESLLKLEASGVKILVCGTCLDYFGLKDKLQAGIVSNMYDISDLFFKACKVIRI